MSQVCSVCTHPDSLDINEALVIEGHSNRRVARQFGLHHDAVRRHRKHIPQLLLRAAEDFQSYEAASILARVEHLEHETLEVLETLKDEEDPDQRAILLAIREQRANIELIAKVRQLIDQAPQVNILLTQEWVRIENAMFAALKDYPQAAASVGAAMRELSKGEGNGAG